MYKGRVSKDRGVTYKTELCSNGPNCRFGNKCEFAHGLHELRTKKLATLEMEGRIPSMDKYRQFPCRSFIMTGSCPYRFRCVFLHDPRIETPYGISVPATKKTGEENVKDTFFWPDMDPEEVRDVIDEKSLPSVNQCYLIPQRFRLKGATLHDKAVFSMWNHFTDHFTPRNNENLTSHNTSTESALLTSQNNKFLDNQRRLPLFVDLSKGKSAISKPKVPPLTVHLKPFNMTFHSSMALNSPRCIEETKEGLSEISPKDIWSGTFFP